MSSFQIILLSIFGAFAVAGVLIFAFFVGGNSGSTIGPVTIWGTFDDVAMQTIIRQLSEDDSRLRQVVYVRKNQETFEADLTNALASGTGPDLFILRHDFAVLDAAKITPIPLETLSSEQFTNLFVDGARPFLTPEGVLAVPLTVDPYMLYWNRDLMASSGFAKPPSYWDEIFPMARTITDCQKVNATTKSVVVGCDEARTIKKATVAFGEYRNIDHAKDIIALLMMQAGSPITLRDSAGALNPTFRGRTTDVAQPAESALNFYTSFADPSKDSYSWNRSLPSSRAAFAAGDLALYIGPASEDALIRRLNPNLNYSIAVVPQVRDSERTATAGVVYGFAVPRAARNPAGALTAAYLLASPVGSKAIASVTGQASARRDVLAGTAEGTQVLVNRQALIVDTWEDPHPIETDRIFRDMIESITSGAAKISEALQRAEQAMRQLATQ